MSSLLGKLIKVAHNNPEIRKHLLPIIKEASVYPSDLRQKNVREIWRKTLELSGRPGEVLILAAIRSYSNNEWVASVTVTTSSGGGNSNGAIWYNKDFKTEEEAVEALSILRVHVK